jgi:hypothetical protein
MTTLIEVSLKSERFCGLQKEHFTGWKAPVHSGRRSVHSVSLPPTKVQVTED